MKSNIVAKDSFRLKESMVSGDKLIIIFTAMGTKIGLYKLFVRMLNKRGYSCVVYDYPLDRLWRADFDEWNEFYYEIIGDAQKRLARAKKAGKKHFFSYGVSMGTLIANKFARDTKDVTHVVLNLTYGDIASNIWTYRGVRKTKKNLEKRGLTKEDLRENMQHLDPIATAKGLRGKKVMLQLAKQDRVLVYKQTKYTKKAFEEAGLDLSYTESKYLGHFMTGAKNMVNLQQLDNFFKS